MIRSLRGAVISALIWTTAPSLSAADQEWPVYGGTAEGTRQSPLRQINARNVQKLRPAWVYR